MSLDQGTIDQLRGERDRSLALLKAEELRIQDYVTAIEKLRETIETLELANATLRRRVESFEAEAARAQGIVSK